MTIQAKDVRRFNLVSIENHTELATVIEIKEKTLRVEYIRKDTNLPHRAVIEIERIKGIPLTEEWLMKLGAIKSNLGYIYTRFYLVYLEVYNYYYVTDFETNAYFTKIEFVHEWQNFISIVEGKELELKINE